MTQQYVIEMREITKKFGEFVEKMVQGNLP